jgi:hypothetical protein
VSMGGLNIELCLTHMVFAAIEVMVQGFGACVELIGDADDDPKLVTRESEAGEGVVSGGMSEDEWSESCSKSDLGA